MIRLLFPVNCTIDASGYMFLRLLSNTEKVVKSSYKFPQTPPPPKRLGKIGAGITTKRTMGLEWAIQKAYIGVKVSCPQTFVHAVYHNISSFHKPYQNTEYFDPDDAPPCRQFFSSSLAMLTKATCYVPQGWIR